MPIKQIEGRGGPLISLCIVVIIERRLSMMTTKMYRLKVPRRKAVKGVVIKYDRVVVMTHNVCGIEWINANYYMKNKLVGVR